MMKKSIGIGFVGGGFITRFHIQSLIGVRNCEVLGIMSRTKSSAEESAALARTIGVGEAKAFETVSAFLSEGDDELKEEVADLVFHLLILLEHSNVEWNDVLTTLKKRMKND